MAGFEESDLDGESKSAGVQTMLNSMIGAGKSVLQKIGAEEIQRFIERQDGVAGPVSVDNVRGGGDVGASSGIVIFTASYHTGDSLVTRDLVLRHAPNSDSRLFYEYDLSRQFEVQLALQGRGVAVPEPLWLDGDGRYFGVSGFVMAHLPGIAPNPSAFTQGPLAEASAGDRQHMLNEIMLAMVKIHQTDVKAVGLENFVMSADGIAPLERCINWYWQTWEWIAVPQFSRLEPVRRWLLERLPEGEPELMHGDTTLHNYLFDDNRLTGVLDWELSSLGRAEADLALQCVGNQLFAAPVDSGLPLPPSDEEWLSLYQQAGGRPMQHFEYYKKLAAYIIVIAVCALQRNLSADECAAQEPLRGPLWTFLESS